MSKPWLIINPISGGSKKTKKRLQLIAYAASYCEIHTTEKRNHAVEIALKAVNNGVSKIIIAGGDGSINEVIQALINTNIELGIIPLGSGNGLATDLKLPKKPIDAFIFALENDAKPVDTILWNQRYMVNVSGMGFDGVVAQLFNENKTRGIIGYTKHFLSQILKTKPTAFRIETGVDSIDVNAHLVSVANSRQYGNHLIISPSAKVNDGFGNIEIIPGTHPINALFKYGLQYLKAITNKKQDEFYLHPDLIHLKFKKATIYNYNLAVTHIDGEPQNQTLINHIELITNSLKIIY